MEDDKLQQELIERAFTAIGNPAELTFVSNGAEGLKYLRSEPPYEKALVPDIVISDLNMPIKGGLDVLLELKNDSRLRYIPVLVFSSSVSHEQILQCYDYSASCYICKPLDLGDFERVCKSIANFWFSTVELPRDRY